MKKNLLLFCLILLAGSAKVLAQGCLPKGTIPELLTSPTFDGDINKIGIYKTTKGSLQGVNELFTSGEEATQYSMEYNGIEYKLTFANQNSAAYWIYHITPAFTFPAGTKTITFYADADGDGISCNRDCDDTNAIVTTPATWYADADGDGYTSSTSVNSCSDPSNGSVMYYQAGSAPNGSGDCDDSDASINPGKTEIEFNDKDDDCNPSTSDDPSSANSLYFDGINDGVDCGSATSLQITGSLTLEAMVKFDQFAIQIYQGNIINKESLTGNNGYGLRAGGNGVVNFMLGNGNWHELNTDANTLQVNKWYHLACTWDNVTKLATIYVDGIFQKQVTIPELSGIGNNNSSLWLGAWPGADPRYPNVTMDEVRIWNTARSAKEIADAMNCELKGTEQGLAAYYQFNQGFNAAGNSTVSSLSDATSNSNHGTLVNFALTGTTSNWRNTSPVVTGTSCNTAPELAPIGSKAVDEDTELNFTVTADDEETPSLLTYSLDAASLAKGMNIGATSGEFSWTPDYTQAGNHEVTVTVSDGELSHSETFTITVNTVTGIVNMTLANFSLYPNPSSGQVLLQLSFADSGVVRICSMEGHVITTVTFEHTDTILIDWEGNPGLYMAEMQTNAGAMARQKLIRN